MNSQRPSSGTHRKDLQGPRPSPLKISRDSHKIRKPAAALPAVVPSVPNLPIIKRSQPMIIYMQSPKIIHAEAQDFMTLVQRLTGSSSSSTDTPNSDHSENPTAPDHVESTVHLQASTAATTQLTTMTEKNQENGSRASEAEANEHGLPAQTSASTVATTPALMPPFSPNFLFPSPRFNFSPRIFQDLPPMTPSSDHFFYSPRDLYRISDPLFSPSQRPALNTLSMLQSPSPTALDLYNNNPEH